jgi:PhnB protein
MVADEFAELGVLAPAPGGPAATVLTLVTDDADALWTRAVEAGAEIVHPLADAFWGERHGQFTDPFGHRWGIAQHLRDVPDAELVRVAAEAFGAAGR